MLLKEIKVSKTNTSKHILENLDEFIIKIDYFDQKGFKEFENKIPLNHIFNHNITTWNKNRSLLFLILKV